MNTIHNADADIQAAIIDFGKQAEEIVEQYVHSLVQELPPQIVYHYTDDKGLKGIIETGEIRFTDIFYLNDPTELKHGIKPAIEIMTAERDKCELKIKPLLDNFPTILSRCIEETAHYFTCSFSSDGDDLGQWRAYADNGRGYAIGFEASMLEQAFVKLGGGHMTFPICYEEEKLRKMQQIMITKFMSVLSILQMKNANLESRKKLPKNLIINLCLSILRSSIFFKHKAYKNEQEYRFLKIFSQNQQIDNIKYTSKPYTLARYRGFDWRSAAPESLREIVIGPAADMKKSIRFANDCLRAFHPLGSAISIVESTIPYRAS